MTLEAWLETGILRPLDLGLARIFAGPGEGPGVWATALASAAQGRGHSCLDLAALGQVFPELDGQESADWAAQLRASPWVARPGERAPLVLEGRRLYLYRLWRDEALVAMALKARLDAPPVDEARLRAGLARLFPTGASPEQRRAAALGCLRRLAVITGGPGTGKTTTVVRLLALLLDQAPDLRIGLAAPTGKAAARLGESIARQVDGLDLAPAVRRAIPTQARTIHRLLRPDRSGFRHGPERHLPLEALVVDEASMVDLGLLARLLEALPASARLILLGDRDQLASVEAGSVLADITGHGRASAYSPAFAARLEALTGDPQPTDPQASGGQTPPLADALAELRHSFRFAAHSGIGTLARRANQGDGEGFVAALSDPAFADVDSAGGDEAALRDCIGQAATAYRRIFSAPDPATALAVFAGTRVLCALRHGPWGVEGLNAAIEARLRAQGLPLEDRGRPLMVTRNDPETGLANGDLGILWPDAQGRPRAWFPGAPGEPPRPLGLARLPAHEPAWALSVHKSQGSEFDRVLLVLPAEDGPLLTRELLYTGVTRARRRLTLYGDTGLIRQACARPTRRASGLAERLGWGP